MGGEFTHEEQDENIEALKQVLINLILIPVPSGWQTVELVPYKGLVVRRAEKSR